MTLLGLRPSGRLGLSPRRRRPSTPLFAPDQIADLAFWYRAGDPQNTVTEGAIEQAFDLSGNGRHGTSSSSSTRPLDSTDPDGRAVMRFDGISGATTVSSPPSLAGGVTVFMAYRVREHVNDAGFITGGIAGGGSGSAQFFKFGGAASANATNLVAKTAQANPITTANRENAGGDREYVVFKIPAASAELRDFNGTATATSDSVAMGTPDLISIASSAFDQSVQPPYARIDVYEVGLYARALSTAELDQLEAYVKSQHAIHWSPGYLDSALAWWHDDWSSVTLSGSLVDQWNDRSGQGRHWTASGGGRPAQTNDAGNVVVRFDGVNDVMSMAGALPALQPFTVALVYRLRNRVDFEGMLSAAAATGVDHVSFWTFEAAAAVSNNMQLFGRSVESGLDQLVLTRPDGGITQIAIWTASAGTATLRDRTGAVSDNYGGSFATPAAIVLGARYNAAPFNFAEIDVMGTVGVTTALAASDQVKLIDWASAKWGV